MPGHPRHAETAMRMRPSSIAPAAPVRIGHHRLPAKLVEGDVLRRVARAAGRPPAPRIPVGIAAVHCNACMPPIEPRSRRAAFLCRGRSISIACARTMSGMVSSKIQPPNFPVAGLVDAGPVEPMQPPITFEQMMNTCRYRADGRDRPWFPTSRLAGDRVDVGDMLIAGQRMEDSESRWIARH